MKTTPFKSILWIIVFLFIIVSYTALSIWEYHNSKWTTWVIFIGLFVLYPKGIYNELKRLINKPK